MVDCRPHCKSKPKFHPYRIVHYFLRRKTCMNGSMMDIGKWDENDERALELAVRAMPGALKRRKRKREYGSFDRWANGNQYGSFNSDED